MQSEYKKEGRERAEGTFEKTVTENFPKLRRDIKTYIQEVQLYEVK